LRFLSSLDFVFFSDLGLFDFDDGVAVKGSGAISIGCIDIFSGLMLGIIETTSENKMQSGR
jgi:hypothetical protein